MQGFQRIRATSFFIAVAISALPACDEASLVDAAVEDDEPTAETVEEHFPGTVGIERTGTFETPDGPRELTYNEIDGVPIFQGDIILAAPDADDEFRSGVVSAFGARWPQGVVPYESTGLFNDSRVVTAINHWQDRTSLRFVPGATTGNRIRFVSGTGCSSSVGMVGGAQVINIASTCSTGNVRHEIGHAIGLFHEHTRGDRNASVIVNTGCIQSGQAGNFTQYGTAGTDIGPYDLGSIMHYSSTAFLNTSIPGCTATLTRLDGTTFGSQRTAATGGDIAGAQSLYLPWTMTRIAADYDGDGANDRAVWRPSDGVWYVIRSSQGDQLTQWGLSGDVPVPADYDGDGRADRAIWRPSTGVFWVLQSINGQSAGTTWGLQGDIPVPADYDGDGRADRAVWRPFDGNWHVIRSAQGIQTTQWGLPGDKPVPGDYDGDGRADRAVYRPSTGVWWILRSSGGSTSTQWGFASDIPVPADYDGDGRTDLAVWRPSTGVWWIIRSSNGAGTSSQWGLTGDVPAPGDYDRDGRDDLTIWRPSTGTWWTVQSGNGAVSTVQWGLSGDVVVH